MLSQTAEYALRAVVYLAERTGEPVPNHELAAAAKIPVGYLSKVLQTLGRRGIVTARRGKTGGFKLARAAATLTILDVINAVDPVQRIKECPLHLKTHRHKLCKLHRRLDEVMVMVEQAFGNTTIADLIHA